MHYTPLINTPDSWYHEIGMKSGLEIHQQLLTRHKLFCHCPAGIYNRAWDTEILRHMRPTLSELGEYDGTALMEFKTRKQIVYRINHQTVCTYEFDDTPPFMINEEAVDIALEVTLLLGCSLVSELHITRKQYLDGSIPTGFQRTTILGVNGRIPYNGGHIDIRQLGLEEDSCREVSDHGHERIYITDRLGMPLIETVTEAQMHTPQAVTDVAEILRYLVRATGKVRTGPGAARQDVNVSVRGGSRCEIKGVCSIRCIPELVHNEAFRQAALLEIRNILRQQGITEKTFTWSAKDLSDVITSPPVAAILEARRQGGNLSGVLIRGFDDVLANPLGPGRTGADEIADRVRVIACLDSRPNILAFHSGKISEYPLLERRVRETMQAAENDAVILVWGPERDVRTATEEIIIRAREFCIGVPEETRQPMPDNTTRFERILPGADRMYPDTDLPPKRVDDGRVERISAALPEPPWKRRQRYLADGLHEDLARLMAVSPFAPVYDRTRESCPKLKPAGIASVLVRDLRGLARTGLPISKLDHDFLLSLFQLLDRGRIRWGAILMLITRRLRGEELAIEAMIRKNNLTPAPDPEIRKAIEHALSQAATSQFATDAARTRHVIGQVMYALPGRIDGCRLADLVRRHMNGEVT